MNDQYSLLCCGISILPLVFSAGIFIGFSVKSKYRERVVLNQSQSEASVRKLIISNFKTPNYYLLNNITLPIPDGTTQIDHILISTKGIFVIETKHYFGGIAGDATAKQWTHFVYKFKRRFQNPIHQNYRHVKTIEQILDFIPKEHIHSIVVFSGNAIFRSPIPQGVLYLKNLVNYLNTYQEYVITINRVEFCVGRLECKRYDTTKATDIQHRGNLAKRFGNSIK